MANLLATLAVACLAGAAIVAPTGTPETPMPSTPVASGPVLSFDDFGTQPTRDQQLSSGPPGGATSPPADASSDQRTTAVEPNQNDPSLPRLPETLIPDATSGPSNPESTNQRPPLTAPPPARPGTSTEAPPGEIAPTTTPEVTPSSVQSMSAPTSAAPADDSGEATGTLQWAARWGDDPGVRDQIDSWIKGPITLASDFGVVPDDGIDDSAGIQAALDATGGGGVVLLPAGVLETTSTLSLTSGQILRGAGAAKTELVFTRSMDWGIELGGDYSRVEGTVVAATKGESSITVAASSPPLAQTSAVLQAGPGRPQNAGEVVRITGVNASGSNWILHLERPISQELDGAEYLPFKAGEGIGVEHLRVRPDAGVSVDYHFVLRGTVNSWVRNVESHLARRAHVYSRQTASCEIRNNTFVDARSHGDGGMGYGINLANRTTGCLVLQNRLSLLRHSMLLHDGATRNVVAYNHSSDPRHPNFVDGGPADMSFHGVATANLVEGNILSRVQLTDAGVAGAENTILRNCLTSGPPTIRNEPTDAWLIGNTIMGSNAALKATTMPAVDGASPRPYTTGDLFDDDGILVQGAAPGLRLVGNWFAGEPAPEGPAIPTSAIQGADEVPAVPTGVAGTDCPYAPR